MEDRTEEVLGFLHNLIALAFLPSSLIYVYFEILVAELSDESKRALKKFLEYYERYWLNIITPRGFSVFGRHQRTNNIVEAFHSQLLWRLTKRPVAVLFARKCCGCTGVFLCLEIT